MLETVAELRIQNEGLTKEVRNFKAADELKNLVIKDADEHLANLAGQMRARSIFNPLEARVAVNPLPAIREVARKFLAEQKEKLATKTGSFMAGKSDAGTLTDDYGTKKKMFFGN